MIGNPRITKVTILKHNSINLYNVFRTIFLYKHVNKPTRWRGTDSPHVLDLVFTNEENMVSEMEYLSPLGKSDHCVLQFQFNCYTKLKIDRRQNMSYDKGNYAEFNKEVASIKWKEFLNPTTTLTETGPNSIVN